MIVLFIKARLEFVAELSLPKGYTYTVNVSPRPDGIARCTLEVNTFAAHVIGPWHCRPPLKRVQEPLN